MADIPQPGTVFKGDDGIVSVVLPDNTDPLYEPPEDELKEYAEYIGIDITKEPELLWIAKEGLRTPLPAEWKACQTGEDEVYYFNFKTGASMWDHPTDDTFKAKVLAERAKLKTPGGGGSGKPGKTSGSTKELSDALLGIPSSANQRGRGGGASAGAPTALPRQGRLGALDRGTSGPAPMPDVSDLLQPVSSPLAPPRVSDLVLRPGGQLSRQSSSSLASPPARRMDVEGDIRRRLEDAYEPRRREMSLKLDKAYIAERAALEEERKTLQRQLESSWKEESQATQAQWQRDLEREVMDYEASWEQRVAKATDVCNELKEQMAAKSAQLKEAQDCDAEEMQRAAQQRARQAVAERTDDLHRAHKNKLAAVAQQNAVALRQLREEHAARVADARRRAREDAQSMLDMPTTAEEGQRGLAELEAVIAQKQQQLEQAQQAAPPAAPAATSEVALEDKARVQVARQAADDAIDKISSACAATMTELKRDYARRVSHLEATLRHAQQTKSAAATATPAAAASSVRGVAEEERRLQAELDASARAYEAETAALAAQSTQPEGDGARDSIGCTAPPSQQEIRQIEAENTRHSAAMKALERGHEQALRQLREAHKAQLASAGRADPRASVVYNTRVAERKRMWLREHPTPVLQLPALEPIPQLTATLHEMSAADAPDERENEKIINERVQAVRVAYLKTQQQELSALEELKSKELADLSTSYRDTRLAEAQRQLVLERQALAASRPPPVAEVDAATSTDDLAEDSRVGDEQPAVEALRAQVQRAKERVAVAAAVRRNATSSLAAQGAAPMSADAAPKLEMYVSAEEAAAEEDALKQRWGARLQRLRAAQQSALQRYEAALLATTAPSVDDDEPKAKASGAGEARPPATALAAAGASGRPPPAPPSGSASAFTTPVNRPQAREVEEGQQFSVPVSSIKPASRALAAERTGDGHHATPRSFFADPHALSQLSLGREADVSVPRFRVPWHHSPGELSLRGGRSSPAPSLPNPMERRDVLFERRLAEIREAIRARRRELRERQRELIALRRDWQHDAQLCRAQRSRSGLRALRRAKHALESRAHALNHDVLKLREASIGFQREELLYAMELSRIEEDNTNSGGGGMLNSPPMSSTLAFLPQPDVSHIAASIIERVGRLESLVQEDARAARDVRGRYRGDGDRWSDTRSRHLSMEASREDRPHSERCADGGPRAKMGPPAGAARQAQGARQPITVTAITSAPLDDERGKPSSPRTRSPQKAAVAARRRGSPRKKIERWLSEQTAD